MNSPRCHELPFSSLSLFAFEKNWNINADKRPENNEYVMRDSGQLSRMARGKSIARVFRGNEDLVEIERDRF